MEDYQTLAFVDLNIGSAANDFVIWLNGLASQS